jgi:cation:H+ antiporter
MPEMAASMMASYGGKSEMAIANVVGSNIFNITLILGVVFLISKNMNPKRDIFVKDSAWIIVPVVIFMLMIQDSVISRADGILFLLIMVSYILFLFTGPKDDFEDAIDEDLSKEKFNWLKTILFLGIGFVLTIGGANFVVESGTDIARLFGVSEWIIGLFLIALGTSLPELVVSLVAVKNGNAEMGIGNIIGSNVANFSMVLGASSIINPLTINLITAQFDIYVMVGSSIALLFIVANKLYNKTGAIFLLTILSLFLLNSF